MNEVFKEPTKKTAEFTVTENYYSFKQEEIEISLNIDYKAKTYTIHPCDGTTRFGFVNGKKENAKMHLAVLKAIERAIKFAESELA